jgi:hypothetical protein
VAALSPEKWREISPYLEEALSLAENERGLRGAERQAPAHNIN